jgi:hypothetical protein
MKRETNRNQSIQPGFPFHPGKPGLNRETSARFDVLRAMFVKIKSTGKPCSADW